MKNDKKRIFIGIDLSDAARKAAAAYIAELRTEFRAVKVGWERAEKLHITLKFLGDVEADRMESVIHEVRSSVKNLPHFDLKVENTGVFPNIRKPRIIWLGLSGGIDALSAIENQLSDNLQRLGFEKEARKFVPHLTIGRVRDADNASLLARTHSQKHFEPVGFNVSEISIFESKILPTGSVYKILERISI
ncbi:MAG: RNA 2',3'-cyclic phosphodiesterase [Pyrinomonadaceae bacterium]|nr:RNA 2',3'-cyclic phosphodiesterase [Pyrinomonadaceae bacterium]